MNEEQRDPTEIQIQAEIYTTMWKDYPPTRRCLFHVPNESTYNNGQQASSGVIAGVVDLIFVWAGRTWYIELKDGTGVISKAQKLLHSLWKVQGYDTYVFYNAADCIDFLKFIISQDGRAFSLDGLSLFNKFVSPHSKAEKYDEYLADYMKARRDNRANKSKKSFQKRY